MSGTPLKLLDIVDLGLLLAAKTGRRKLGNSTDDQQFYEEFFTDVDDGVASAQRDLRKQIRVSAVVEAVRRHVPAGRVLDVGCGIGETLAGLAPLEELELFGVEYSQATLARAAKRVGARARLQDGTATSLPFEDQSFEGITCVEVLEHIEADGRALSEFRRVLKPGGILVLTVPSRHWFPAYKRLIGHHRHYDRTTLERLMSAAGLEVVEWLPNYPDWHRLADYSYVACSIFSRGMTRIGRAALPTTVRMPGGSHALLDQMFAALEPLRSKESLLDYSGPDTSTWVVARKAGR